VLSIRHLNVNYGSISAVRDLTLEINKGEFVALIGANGAGKSTTLMTVAGVISAAGGEIEFQGKSILKNSPDQLVAQGISLVPEGRRILGNLTVKENLQLGTTVRKDRVETGKDIEKILEKFPILKNRYSRLAGHLSGGEQQQLAFARALLSRPKLLLCDEPSSGLSPIMTDEVFQTLEDLHAEGLTILLVEQFAARAIEMATKSYIIKKGSIAFSGTREEMKTNVDMSKTYFGISK